MKLLINTSSFSLLGAILLLAGIALPGMSRDHRENASPGRRPILWKDPGEIEKLDLYYGIGGPQGDPNPKGRFLFLSRKGSFSDGSEKIIVRDGRGRRWTVKFGRESKPETVATRIAWAAGFHVDENYFVPRVRIEGRRTFIARDIRFERDNDGYKTIGRWDWNSNPFEGTRELGGLKTLMALLGNWDLKKANNKIVQRSRKRSDASMHIYYVNDLGATFGSTGYAFGRWPLLGEFPSGTKGIPSHYASETLVRNVNNGTVTFNVNRRKATRMLRHVKTEDALWMANLLARLSDDQLKDAFRAGGYGESEILIYVSALRDRIQQLQSLAL